MRKIVICGLILGASVLAGCPEESSGGKAEPGPSANPGPSAAPAPSTAPSPSGSAKAENDKKKEGKPEEKEGEGPKDHKLLIKAIGEAWGSHDAKKVAALYSLGAVMHTPGQPEVKGREAIEKSAAGFIAGFKDLAFVPGRAWAKDKKTLVVEMIVKGTNTGDLPDMGIKATNKPIGISGASWMTIGENGLIKEEHTYWDSVTMMGQLNPDKKNPVRALITAPPDGDKHYEASSKREEKAEKDPKEKAEIAMMVKVEKEEIEIENKGIAAINAGKQEEFLKMIAKDYRYADYTEEKDTKGEKEFKELLGMWFKAIPDLKQKSEAAFADAEFAIEEFEYTGTHKGPFGPIKATNKPVTLHQLEVDEFKDGKFVRSWAWWNKAELLTEIGVMPAPGSAPAPAPSGSAKSK